MDFKSFKEQYSVSGAEIAKEVFSRHREKMQVKKEKTAVSNLEKIFTAVFNITQKKGFQAMTMRDLSAETGMSLGSLYAYFSSKETLLEIIQAQGWEIVRKNLETVRRLHDDPEEKLYAVIRAHLFLSELFRPWFYFTFMEARNIRTEDFEKVKAMEAYTQDMLLELLEQGEKENVFVNRNHDLTAAMIKSMQQDWYLKRWKYKALNVGVDQFGEHLVAMVTAFCK